jgi:hypothetical protein
MDPATVVAGGSVVVRMDIMNLGGGGIGKLYVVDTLPAGLVFVDQDSPAGLAWNGATSGAIAWTSDAYLLNSGVGISVTLYCRATEGFGGVVSNEAWIRAYDGCLATWWEDADDARITVLNVSTSGVVTYPNPATGNILNVRVNLQQEASKFTVRVYNAAMRLVYEGEWSNVSIASGGVSITGVSDWAPGIYIVKAKAVWGDGASREYPASKVQVK